MKHMFGGGQWSPVQNGPLRGTPRPGVQVTVVGGGPGHFQMGGAQLSRPLPFKSSSQSPAQMEGECADGSCSTHQQQPSKLPMNRVPMGKKTDCPVCRSFGGGKSGF